MRQGTFGNMSLDTNCFLTVPLRGKSCMISSNPPYAAASRGCETPDPVTSSYSAHCHQSLAGRNEPLLTHRERSVTVEIQTGPKRWPTYTAASVLPEEQLSCRSLSVHRVRNVWNTVWLQADRLQSTCACTCVFTLGLTCVRASWKSLAGSPLPSCTSVCRLKLHVVTDWR